MNSVPSPACAGEFHRAMMRLHDPVGNGKAETGALPDGLGGEERLEDSVADLLRYSFSGIADANHEMAVLLGGGDGDAPGVRRIASMALATTFMSTWFSSPAKQVSISTSPYWRSTSIRPSILCRKNRRTDSILSWMLMVLTVPSSSREKVRSLDTSSFTRVAPACASPIRVCILLTFADTLLVATAALSAASFPEFLAR